MRFLALALNARACASLVQIGIWRESDETEHFSTPRSTSAFILPQDGEEGTVRDVRMHIA